MFRKFAAGIVVIVLAILVNSTQAQDYPDQDQFDWVCYGGLIITCDKTGDDQANVYLQWPEGYCIGLTLPDYIGDGVQYYAYYMVPCEPTTPPEMPEEVQKWASDATEGSVHIDWLGTWTMGPQGYIILDEGEGKASLWLEGRKIGFVDPKVDNGEWQGVEPGQTS